MCAFEPCKGTPCLLLTETWHIFAPCEGEIHCVSRHVIYLFCDRKLCKINRYRCRNFGLDVWISVERPHFNDRTYHGRGPACIGRRRSILVFLHARKYQSHDTHIDNMVTNITIIARNSFRHDLQTIGAPFTTGAIYPVLVKCYLPVIASI